MHLKKIEVKNFRLLYEAALLLEKQTTVIVGRNNSGKTSLTEVMTRLLAEGNPTSLSLQPLPIKAIATARCSTSSATRRHECRLIRKKNIGPPRWTLS
jgi:predicted ATP-dependent endonuclease of OLD family